MVVRTRITCNFAQSKIIKEKNMRLKKFLSPCAIGIVAVLFTCSCKDEEETKESYAEELNEFVASLPMPSQDPIPARDSISDALVERSDDGKEICTSVYYEQSASFDENLLLDPSTDVIFPGALIDGGSIISGDYIPITIDRAPIKLYTDLLNKNGKASIVVDHPTPSSITQAIKELINDDEVNGATTAKVSFEVEEIKSSEELDLKIGVSLNAKKASVANNFEFNKNKNKRSFLIKMIDVMYSINMDFPQKSSDLFSSNIKANELKNALSSNTMPCYVSSVKYGRSAYIAFETNDERIGFGDSLKAKLNAFGMSAEAKSEVSKLVSNSSYRISGTIIGGNADDALSGINSLDKLIEFVQSKGSYSKDNPPAMLSYTLRRISDNRIFSINKAAKYTVKNCETYSGGIRLSAIEAISGEHNGGEDQEPYGYVKMRLNGVETTIFNLLRDNHLVITRGETKTVEGSNDSYTIGGKPCIISDGPTLNLNNMYYLELAFAGIKDFDDNPMDDNYYTDIEGNSESQCFSYWKGYYNCHSLALALEELSNGAHSSKFYIDLKRPMDKKEKKKDRVEYFSTPDVIRLHFVITLD